MSKDIEFNDLPEWLKTPIMKIRPKDYDKWIHEPVPALHNRSVTTLMKLGKPGEEELREYVTRVIGYFLVEQGAGVPCPPLDAGRQTAADHPGGHDN